jgi:hypothetical protein
MEREKLIEISVAVVNLFAEKECTAHDAQEVLRYLMAPVLFAATVHKVTPEFFD